MEEKTNLIEMDIADAIMGRPYGFTIGDKQFHLYPVTLGKFYLLHRQIDALGINQENIKIDVNLEALRLVREKKDICLSILTYHTCKDKDEVFDDIANEKKRALFEQELTEEELATLMLIFLTGDKADLFMDHLGIREENENLQKAIRVKSDKNTLSFGGRSQFGSLIDAACERYGWTKDYVVWGIDYTSLRLMLADKVTSIYLSDEERKKLPASLLKKDEDVIIPTKENMERILEMDWR